MSGLKKVYHKLICKQTEADTDMYYDPEWAMVRSIKDNDTTTSYCASPVITNKSFRRSLALKSNLNHDGNILTIDDTD